MKKRSRKKGWLVGGEGLGNKFGINGQKIFSLLLHLCSNINAVPPNLILTITSTTFQRYTLYIHLIATSALYKNSNFKITNTTVISLYFRYNIYFYSTVLIDIISISIAPFL